MAYIVYSTRHIRTHTHITLLLLLLPLPPRWYARAVTSSRARRRPSWSSFGRRSACGIGGPVAGDPGPSSGLCAGGRGEGVEAR